MPSEFLLTIDFGTSGIKCMIFTLKGEVRIRKFTPISYHDVEGSAGIGKEFDASAAWTIIAQMTQACLTEAKVPSKEIIGVAATSQRHGAVFIDEHGNIIYSGPNLDARGVFMQDVIIKHLEVSCPPTGCWPPLLYTLCRLLWYKEYKPDLYANIRHVLSISDWIVYQLTGEVTTEPSQASTTQLMNIHSSQWSPEILKIAEIPESWLPHISDPGTKAGKITSEASKTTGLPEGVPVGVGGADTQCALLGSGVIEPGTVCVVAGNTAPIQLVTSKPLIDTECRLWTHRHMLPNRWVLEANTGKTGEVLTWFAKNFLTPSEEPFARTDYDPYLRAEELAKSAPVGSLDTIALLGPQVMDASALTTIRPSLFLFPSPTSPVVTPISLKELSRALFENICYAVRMNLELISDLSKITHKQCVLTGGLARSQLLQQMLADVTGIEIVSGQVVEASSLGAAICAATAVRHYKSLKHAMENMVTLKPAFQPDETVHQKYEPFFRRWLTLYKQSTTL